MIRHIETVSLALLRGDVADIYFGGIGGGDAAAYALDQEIRQNACVEAAGTEDDQVRFEDGADGLGVSGRVVGYEVNTPDATVGIADIRLAVNSAEVLRAGAKRNVRKSGRDDLTAYGEHATRLADRVLEVAHDARHGDDEEVSERVTSETRP